MNRNADTGSLDRIADAIRAARAKKDEP
jgi:hypothetical protein